MEILLEKPVYLLMIWLALMSLVLFIYMGIDKSCARRGARRVPEARLFLFALLGGAPGGWLGMYAFRHKTKHLQFVLGFALIALLQIAACVWLLIKS